MKYSSVPLLFVLSLVPFVGCKKDSANPATQQSAFVGTWNPQSATVNGTATPVAQALNWVNGAVAARLTINANATFSYSELDGANAVLYSNSGTYAISGNSVTLTWTTVNGQPLNPPETATLTWAVAGNQLTTTSSQGGNTVVVVYTKV
jgi:redox-sensitive bicupin YhaK (pirin superfamily)